MCVGTAAYYEASTANQHWWRMDTVMHMKLHCDHICMTHSTTDVLLPCSAGSSCCKLAIPAACCTTFPGVQLRTAESSLVEVVKHCCSFMQLTRVSCRLILAGRDGMRHCRSPLQCWTTLWSVKQSCVLLYRLHTMGLYNSRTGFSTLCCCGGSGYRQLSVACCLLRPYLHGNIQLYQRVSESALVTCN